MCLDVATCNPVVEPMPKQLTDENANDWSEVEIAERFLAVPVAADFDARGEKDGRANIDPDCPGANEQAVFALARWLERAVQIRDSAH